MIGLRTVAVVFVLLALVTANSALILPFIFWLPVPTLLDIGLPPGTWTSSSTGSAPASGSRPSSSVSRSRSFGHCETSPHCGWSRSSWARR